MYCVRLKIEISIPGIVNSTLRSKCDLQVQFFDSGRHTNTN